MHQNKKPQRPLAAILAEDSDLDSYLGAVSPPIFQTSIFAHDDVASLREALADEAKGLIYTRGNNPTVRACEQKLAELEHGEDARLFSSGVAATAAAVLPHLGSGDHALCVADCYGWTRRLFDTYLKRFGVEATFVNGSEPEAFEPHCRPNTRVIYLESPASMTFSLQNLRGVAELARGRGITTIIDNTWATPVFQNPLDLGINLVVHSVSKYLGGHSDIVAGCVVGDAENMDLVFGSELLATGAVTTPMQAWLILRGLRTLELRLERHQANARRVIDYLAGHPAVEKVLYPLHQSHPHHELALRQMRGGSGLFSFVLQDHRVSAIEGFVNALRVPRLAVSWGGYESLVFPAIAKLPPHAAEATGPAALIRLHVGLEPPETLIADLDQALEGLG